MNRGFEALERAGVSQALETAAQPPRQNLASLCVTHLPAEAGGWAENMGLKHTRLVGREETREVQTHSKVRQESLDTCPQVSSDGPNQSQG